jgi:hypothetical protein
MVAADEVSVLLPQPAGSSKWGSCSPHESFQAALARVWATTRGELVMCEASKSEQVPGHCLVSADGQPFAAATPPGLDVDTLGDGFVRSTVDAVYVSDDGWTWRRL